MNEEKYIMMGIMGALASATRNPGVMLAFVHIQRAWPGNGGRFCEVANALLRKASFTVLVLASFGFMGA